MVAEGPEDWDTVQALRSLRCDRAQGYVFSRPVELEKFYALRQQFFSTGEKQERA